MRKREGRKWRRMPALLLAACVSASAFWADVQTVSAVSVETQEQIDDMKEQQEETQEQLDAASAEKQRLETAKANLENYLMDLNDQLAQLSAELTELESELTATQQELEQTQAELEAARIQEEEQYEDMKLRIQFMYENGNVSMLTMFLEADSISDFLNRAEYTTQLAAYDRAKLEEYKGTKELIQEKEAQIETEKAELEALQQQKTDTQEEVSALVQSTGAQIAQYTAEIDEAQRLVDQYEGKLAEQESALDELMEKAEQEEEEAERKKAEETAREQGNSGGATTSGSSGTTNNGAVSASSSDVDMLAALIYCEAGGEPYEGQLAVGSVVMNRVRSASYPNSIMGVIYQAGQFSPVASGRFIIVLSQGLATASCRQAAQAAISGQSNGGNCLYFRRNTGGISGIVIGNHVFY